MIFRIFVLLLLLASPASADLMMTGMGGAAGGGSPPPVLPAHVQTAGAGDPGNFVVSLTTTMGSAVGSGHALVVSVWGNDPGMSGVTVTESPNTGNTFTNVLSCPGNSGTGQIWVRANVTDTPTTIIANIPGGITDGGMTVDEFSGVATSGIVTGMPSCNDQTFLGSGGGPNTLVSGNTTPGINGALIYGATMTVASKATLGPGSGFAVYSAGNTDNSAVGTFDGVTFQWFEVSESVLQSTAGPVQAVFGCASDAVIENITGVVALAPH